MCLSLKRSEGKLAFWISQNGMVEYMHYINFAILLVRLSCLMAWLGHIGSCIWHAVAETGDDHTAHQHDAQELIYWTDIISQTRNALDEEGETAGMGTMTMRMGTEMPKM